MTATLDPLDTRHADPAEIRRRLFALEAELTRWAVDPVGSIRRYALTA